MLGLDKGFSTMIFSAFDKSGDGYIDLREFVAAMGVMLNPDDIEQQITLAFDAYDLNNDGKLDQSELQSVIGAIFSTMNTMGMPQQVFPGSNFSEAAAASTADDLFKLMDEEGKGYITREDYIELARTRPELIKQIGLGGSSPVRRGRRASTVGGSRPRGAKPKPRKRGVTIGFGHDRWELVVQMMLGIRISLSRIAESKKRLGLPLARESSHGAIGDLLPMTLAQFDEVRTFEIPSHKHGRDHGIQFKDYSPLVFHRIRRLFNIPEDEYALSLGPEQILGELLLGTLGSLTELFSEGKSGSFFYFSNDALYLIKTIPHREARSLRQLLPAYVRHVEQHPHTLLPRYLGFHRLILPGTGKTHFVVMANVFSTSLTIHERYDLKGSSLGRTAGKALVESEDPVRKDLDLKRPFRIAVDQRKELLQQLHLDINFLREIETMDYSLLCGVHYPNREEAVGGGAADDGPQRLSVSVSGIRPLWVDSSDGGINAAPDGEAEPAIYFMAIIDILTAWSPAKRTESVVKQVMYPTKRKGVSCVPPGQYAERFQKALPKWIG